MQNSLSLKIIIVLEIFVFVLFKQTNAQYYLGYPYYVNNLPDSSKIILDMIPGASDGHFNSETIRYFEQMCQFMGMHPNFICNIYLYDFESSSYNKRLDWTRMQVQRIKEFLDTNDNTYDFSFINDIIASGQKNPIFEHLSYPNESNINKQDCYNLKQSIILDLIFKK